jgi:membrane protein
LSDRPTFVVRARAELWLAGRAAWRGFIELISGDDLTHAASVAYCGLLSLFPAFLLAFGVFGAVAAKDSNRAAVIEFFLRYFPARFEFVSQQLDSLGQMPLTIGVGGGLALVWAAHGVFSAITSAINYAWKVEKPRGYLKHKLISLLMLVTAGVILLAALVLVSVIQIVRAGWFATVVAMNPRLAALGGMAVSYATTVMLIVVVGLIYAFVPHTKVRLRDVWVGAILTGLLMRGVLEAFSYYVRDLSKLNALHGSIAAVIVFLIWVYSSAVVLLYGAEFTATYIRLRKATAARQL